MEGIGVVMPVENEMNKPHQFLGCPGVLNIAMSTVVVMYAFVGFCGYLNYGEDARGSLTLNLPEHEILAQVAKVLVACVMMLSFALIYYVPVDVVWRRIQDKIPPSRQRWSLAGVRLVGTLLIVGLAAAIPKLELFMELVGAVCLSILGLFLPAVVETVWRWGKGYGTLNWIIWKNLLIVIFAIVALVSGVTFSLMTMIENL